MTNERSTITVRTALTLAGVAALTLAAVSACTTEPDPEPATTAAATTAETTTEATPEATPTPTPTPSDAPEPASETPTTSALDLPDEHRIYLADLRVLAAVDDTTLSDTRAIMLGTRACEFLTAAQGFDGTAAAIEGMANGLTAEQAQGLTIAAVMNLCPEHDAELPQ